MKQSATPETRVYKGWHIWRWTGWKSVLGKMLRERDRLPHDRPCQACGAFVEEGQLMAVAIGEDVMHWLCKFPEDPQDHYVGQLLFTNGEGRFCYVAVPPGGAGEYKPGDAFDIGSTIKVTEDTAEDEKDGLIARGIDRMYSLIDELESA